MHPPFVQGVEGIPRAVADREHHPIGRQIAAFVQVQAAKAPRAVGGFVDVEVDHPVFEPVFAAEAFDLPSKAFHHLDEAERADVRMGIDQDFPGSARFGELGEDLATEMPRILDLAPELSIRESPGAPLAELHVRLGIQHTAPPETPRVLRPFSNALAAIENDRSKAHFREDQSGEEAARPRTDHDGTRVGARYDGLCDESIVGVWLRANTDVAGAATKHRLFVDHRDIDRIDHHDRRLLPRIVRASRDFPRLQRRRLDREKRDDRIWDGARRMPERQSYFVDAQHLGVVEDC